MRYKSTHFFFVFCCFFFFFCSDFFLRLWNSTRTPQIAVYHHHHHVVPTARSSLTLSFSLAVRPYHSSLGCILYRWARAHTHTHTHTHIYIYIYMCVCVCMCVCIPVYICVCVCVCVLFFSFFILFSVWWRRLWLLRNEMKSFCCLRFKVVKKWLRSSILWNLVGSLTEWVECSPMARETGVECQFESYQRFKRWYLMPTCLTLNTTRYELRVKWNNTGKGVALFPTPWYSSKWKRGLRITLDYYRQLYKLI